MGVSTMSGLGVSILFDTSYLSIENKVSGHIRGYCIFWDPRNVKCLWWNCHGAVGLVWKDDLQFYLLSNSTSVISGRSVDGYKRLCAVEPHLRLRFGLKPNVCRPELNPPPGTVYSASDSRASGRGLDFRLAAYLRFLLLIQEWQLSVSKVVLINGNGDLSLPRKSVVRLTNCPNIFIAVYPWRKTPTQQYQNSGTHCTGLVDEKLQLLPVILSKTLGFLLLWFEPCLAYKWESHILLAEGRMGL